MNKLTFSIFADIHIGIFPYAKEYFDIFLAENTERKPDFTVQLGDILVYRPWIRTYTDTPDKFDPTGEYEKGFDWHVDYYKDFKYVRQSLPDMYSVLGNHDCDRCTKAEFCAVTGMPAPYYRIDRGGFTFLMLDTDNYYSDGKLIAYDNQNYMKDKNTGTMRDVLGAEQLEWLSGQIAHTPFPVVLFSHAPLDVKLPECEMQVFRKILSDAKSNGKKIMFCANGHTHIDALVNVEGIYYWEVNSMTNRFLGRQYPPINRFGEENLKRYPNIRFAAPYTKPLYAFVTLSENGDVEIEGKAAEYMDPQPEQIGFIENNPKGSTPAITSRKFNAFED